MASFPPRAASEQGLAGRPLGAPVISCAGCGALASRSGQEAGLGISSPPALGWLSLRPEELLLLAGPSAATPARHPLLRACLEASPARVCPDFPDGKPKPIPAALSLLQTPRAPPSAPQPLWSQCWPHRTEDGCGWEHWVG